MNKKEKYTDRQKKKSNERENVCVNMQLNQRRNIITNRTNKIFQTYTIA